jgi:hypothetical protein
MLRNRKVIHPPVRAQPPSRPTIAAGALTPGSASVRILPHRLSRMNPHYRWEGSTAALLAYYENILRILYQRSYEGRAPSKRDGGQSPPWHRGGTMHRDALSPEVRD